MVVDGSGAFLSDVFSTVNQKARVVDTIIQYFYADLSLSAASWRSWNFRCRSRLMACSRTA